MASSSARDELSELTAGVFDGGVEVARLEALLARLETGTVDDELLEECPPELRTAIEKNEKLKYRKEILARSIAEASAKKRFGRETGRFDAARIA